MIVARRQRSPYGGIPLVLDKGHIGRAQSFGHAAVIKRLHVRWIGLEQFVLKCEGFFGQVSDLFFRGCVCRHLFGVEKSTMGVEAGIERIVFIQFVKKQRFEQMVPHLGIPGIQIGGLLKILDRFVVLQTVVVIYSAKVVGL